MRARNTYSPLLFACVLSAVVARPSESARTDVLILDNGDRITGEILSLERGKMSYKTDNVGTLSVEWIHVAELRSTNFFTFETQSGALYSGSLAEAEEPGQLKIVDGEVTRATLDIDEVVGVYRVKPSFWSRLDGSLDVGYSYTQQNGSTQYNLNASARETTEHRQVKIDFASLLSTQDDAATTTRNSLSGTFYRLTGSKWFYVGLASIDQNNGLDLDLRTLVGGGIGRSLYQTSSGELIVLGGLDYNREFYSFNDEPVNSLEAVGGIEYAYYTFDGLTSQLTTSFIVTPSLTDAGRIRLQLDANLRQNIIGNLYWNLDVYETYDSRPPQPDAPKNDFGITTSLGWTF